METGNPIRILFVEDVPSDAEMAERELQNFGIPYTSVRVDTKDAFIKALEEFRPDIIISDYSMPQFDGMQALKLTQEYAASIPFILLTGSMNEETAVECMKSGAMDYIIKERIKRLPFAVREALEQKKNRLAREEARQALLKSEVFIKTVLDNLPVGVAVNSVDPAVTFWYMNDNFPRFYRTTREKLSDPDAFWSAVYEDPAFREEMKKRVLDDCAGGNPERMYWADIPITRKGEKTSFITARNIPVPDRSLMISTVWDVTFNKQVEEELRKLSRAVEQSPASIIITDRQGDIEYVNPKFTEVTGYSIEEVRGKNPRILKSGETSPEEYRKLWQTITSGDEWHGVFHNRRKDGTLFLERVSISSVRDTSGAITHFLAVKEDITDQKSLEDQFRQAQKMEAVGQLAGGIAHDFNNILTAVIGYGYMLKIKLTENNTLRTYADHILSLSERAANLTQSLLAFSRKQVMNPRPLNLHEIIRTVEKLLSRIIGEDIALKTTLSERDLIIMADHMQIEQVLMNLATNARDAMPKGGLLTIGTEKVDIDPEFIRGHGYGKEGPYAVISITDSGAGMDRETREKIFDPFFTTKEVGKGTGLGLSMVYGIIKQHDGYIDVYSEPGEGTIFRIYLPLIEAKADEMKPEFTKPLETGMETILLAEDEAEVRAFTAKLLEEYGYKVIEAIDGEDAIGRYKLHKDEIQLVMLDVIMPNRSGREVYEAIKKITPDIKVLFTSGYPADHISGMIAEGTPFILKPLAPTRLLKKIREVLDA